MGVTLGDTIYRTFTTRTVAGAPFTLAGSPVVSAYENDNTTEITAGITLGVDHDSRTGLNLLTIVATGANGFETNKDYNLVITVGSVNSVSVVGETVVHFGIERDTIKGIAGTKNTFDDLNDFNESTDPVELLDSGGSAGTSAAELVDDVLDDAIPEPTSTFAWPASLRNIAGWIGAMSRNKLQQDATFKTLRNDADSGDISTASVLDDGSEATRGEWS